MSWSDSDETTGSVNISINGSIESVSRDSEFAQTVKDLAREKGYSHYKVFVDGEEVEPADAPEDFAGVDDVSIVKYDKAA